jgi:hypothetical protein
LGYVVLLMLQLYSVSPLLPLAPIVALKIIITSLSSLKRILNSEQSTKLSIQGTTKKKSRMGERIVVTSPIGFQ